MNSCPIESPAKATWTARVRSGLRNVWQGIREWCGDAAYESYLRSKHTKCCCAHPLSAKQFYLEQADRKYSRPNRCC